MALDINGNIYVAANVQNQIVKVTPAGVLSIVASATSPGGNLLDIPTSLAFGHGSEQTTMFICNSSEFASNYVVVNGTLMPQAPANPAGAGLLALDLGIPGISANCTQTITPVAIIGTNAPYSSPASPFNAGTVAVDLNNNCYVNDQKTGNIIEVTPSGVTSLFATKPGPPNASGGRTRSLVFDGAGNLCVCGPSSNALYNGVFKVSPNGTVSAFCVNQGFTGPLYMCFDRQGNLYLSDAVNPLPSQPIIWKINPAGTATRWSVDPLLKGSTNYGFPYPFIGPAGIAFSQDGNVLYVANPAAGEILKVPVNADGSAGAASVFASGADLVGAYDLALDIDGNIYVAINIQSEIAMVTPGGAVSILASTNSPGGNLLWFPTGIAFGHGPEQTTLFIANNANTFTSPAPKPTLGGLLALDPDIPGISANSMVAFPSITNQTTDFTYVLGQTNVLSVGATGGNLSYQWYFDGTPIPGQTGSSLTLADLSDTNAGAYTVQISNPLGATNSAAIDVSYFGSPQLYIGMVLAGAIGQNFQIDYSTNLATTNWITLTNLTLTTSPQLFVDTTAPAQSQRFYGAVTH